MRSTVVAAHLGPGVLGLAVAMTMRSSWAVLLEDSIRTLDFRALLVWMPCHMFTKTLDVATRST